MIEKITAFAMGALLVSISFYTYKLIIRKRRKTPETVPGFSLFDKDGKPIAWFRETQDMERYRNGTNGRMVHKKIENDFYYYKDK